ncbi:DUF456 domain-containing protein [Bremerella cremea]|uniref:DUF456 domain-containing protein n=1 Tax=Blastopirellula marina TaxID=124 RepID=A0A2S8FWF9_9BACT|nr:MULTISPECIES: DUF456 domain-containing protein [Pirellulaceae]PQO36174.1 hypothetical protein C5Y83_09670 [Blastopirellula marina]RCS48851.1 DUF456 domain-containing protein [Bremerella cremea]
MVYVAALLLMFANLAAWVSTLFTLPGNWILLAFTILYAYFLPADYFPRISWTVVIFVAVIALIGELIEFLAGAAGAAKQGGSKLGIFLSLVGAFIGSLGGAIFLSFIPLIGTMVGALLGGAFGAFAGAWLGEHNTQKTSEERFNIGKGAFIGRILGTVGKLSMGVIMLVVVTLDSFLDMKGYPQLKSQPPMTVTVTSEAK